MINLYNQIKLFIYNYKKRIITIISLLVIFIISTIIFVNKNNDKEELLVYEDNHNSEFSIKEIDNQIEDEKEDVYYYVDIKGYVNNPGVYSILKGKRVVDALNIAGGLKKEANTRLMNLSLEVTDQMVIIVYSNNEINDFLKTQEQEIKENKICNEIIKNDSCIINNNQDINPNLIEKKEKKEEKVEENNDIKIININTATKEELMTLNKIGESKAISIIEYREKNGLFKSIEDIKNVSGIGDALFESIKEFITI